MNFGGVDTRSGNYAGRVKGFVFYPQLNGGARTPTPHSAANADTIRNTRRSAASRPALVLEGTRPSSTSRL